MLLVPLRNVHADHLNFGHLSSRNDFCSFDHTLSRTSPFQTPFLHYPIQNGIYQPVSGLPMAPSAVSIPISSPYLVDQPVSYQSQDFDPTRRAQLSNSNVRGISSPYSSSPVNFSPPLPQIREQSNSILYNLLNQNDQGYSSSLEGTSGSPLSVNNDSAFGTGTSNSPQPHERKVTSRFVSLQNPEETCNVASKVLVKIVNFVKNLVPYKNLCNNDQIELFQNCWAELFIVGMAQEKIKYETIEYELTVLPNDTVDEISSGSHALPILSQQRAPRTEEAAKLKSFIQRCWDQNLTTAEYAYFMGTILFDPDVPGLQQRDLIESLQMEARHALASYRGETSSARNFVESDRYQQLRLAQILLGLPALRSMKTQAVVDLFFRPIFGTEANLEKMLVGLMTQ